MKKTTLDLTTIGLFVAGLFYFYWATLNSLHDQWVQVSANYSHGYLLVAVSLYLFYEARTQQSLSNNYRLWQLFTLPLAISSLFWLFADIVQIQLIQQLAILAVCFFFLAMLFGIEGAKQAIFPAGLVILAIPVWSYIVGILQFMTVVVCSLGLSILDIPAHIYDNYVQLPAGLIHVANSCSGLNFFLIAVSLGAIQAELNYHRLSRKVLLILIATGIGLLSNWIRVFSLVVIGHVTNMQSSLMTSHFWHGWILFAIAMVLLFYISIKLRDEPPETIKSDTEKSSVKPINGEPSIATLALLLAFCGPLLALWLSAGQAELSTAKFPSQADEWELQVVNNAEWNPDFQSADFKKTLLITKNHQRAYLYFYSYINQEQGKELIYYENKISDENWTERNQQLKAVNQVPYYQSILKSKNNIDQKLVTYWYQIGDIPTTSGVKAKWLQLKNFFKGRSDVALVAIAIDCGLSCDTETELSQQLIPMVAELYRNSMQFNQ